MPDGVLLVAAERVLYANPASARLLGGDPSRIVAAMREHTGASFLVQVHHPAAREVQCHRTSMDADTTLIIARDVTEARRVERMRQDFVANASHELKTPAAAILATAETLRMAIVDDPDASARFVETLASEAQRMSALVQDLLDLARLDREQAVAGTCDAGAVAGAAVAQIMTRAPGATITLDVDDGLMVGVAEGDLSIAVTNLLENALRHTPRGTVAVRARLSGTQVIIEVADTGEGIPAKDLPRIFERFYRVDRARARETGGTGLGLAIVKHIAEQAGGSLSVQSIYGEGATFTIRLPFVP